MLIWSNAVAQRPEDAPSILKADFWPVKRVGMIRCIYCGNELSLLDGERLEREEPWQGERKYHDEALHVCRIVEACPRCGWWVATIRASVFYGAHVDRWP